MKPLAETIELIGALLGDFIKPVNREGVDEFKQRLSGSNLKIKSVAYPTPDAKTVSLGAGYTGKPYQFIDSSTGCFRASLPTLTRDELKIQQLLFQRAKNKPVSTASRFYNWF